MAIKRFNESEEDSKKRAKKINNKYSRKKTKADLKQMHKEAFYQRKNKAPFFIEELGTRFDDFVDGFENKRDLEKKVNKTPMSGTLAGIVREPMKKKNKKKTMKK